MPTIIKIVNEQNDGQARFMGGYSGLTYVFQWDKEAAAYCYAAKSQTECDDIMAVMRIKDFPWSFSVVYDPSNEPAVSDSPGRVRVPLTPFISPKLYSDYPAADLEALARDLGFTPQGDISNCDNIRRQIDACCIGRSWNTREMARLTEQVKELQAEVARLKPVEITIEDEAPPPAAAPAPTEPMPPARVRLKPGPKPGSKRTRVAA